MSEYWYDKYTELESRTELLAAIIMGEFPEGHSEYREAEASLTFIEKTDKEGRYLG